MTIQSLIGIGILILLMLIGIFITIIIKLHRKIKYWQACAEEWFNIAKKKDAELEQYRSRELFL